jgi:hypothetical protein
MSFGTSSAMPGCRIPTWKSGGRPPRTCAQGGSTRILVPHPDTLTVEELWRDGVRGEVYAHELIQVARQTARSFLDMAMEDALKQVVNACMRRGFPVGVMGSPGIHGRVG